MRAGCFTGTTMPSIDPGPVRMPITFGRACRATRIGLDLTLQQVATRVGITGSYLARIERGLANPTLSLIEAIAGALGLEIDWVIRAPIFIEGHPRRDLVHARCSASTHRRLTAAGWAVVREVEVVHGRQRGWIDLLAFDPRTETLYVIEIKTRLDDVGALERQVAWYERLARATAAGFGWRPRSVVTWVLALASEEVELAIRANREVLRLGFPWRGPELVSVIADQRPARVRRGLALIDPRSRRRNWLIAPRVDGRRSPAPYRDYADAARLMAA
jgi:transcriptional regulator with XRE-family HTH domain